MKKRIISEEYKYNLNLIFVGVLFLIMVIVFIINTMMTSEEIMGNHVVSYIFLFTIGMVLLIYGVGNNKNTYKMRKWRKNMLNQPYVYGRIVDIREIRKTSFGKVISSNEYSTDHSSVYVLLVEYENPYTGRTCTVESDEYSEMLEYLLLDNKCRVYINQENESWILVDGFNIRKSIRDPYIQIEGKFENRGEGIRFIGDIIALHQGLLIAFSLGLISLIVFIMIRI